MCASRRSTSRMRFLSDRCRSGLVSSIPASPVARRRGEFRPQADCRRHGPAALPAGWFRRPASPGSALARGRRRLRGARIERDTCGSGRCFWRPRCRLRQAQWHPCPLAVSRRKGERRSNRGQPAPRTRRTASATTPLASAVFRLSRRCSLLVGRRAELRGNRRRAAAAARARGAQPGCP